MLDGATIELPRSWLALASAIPQRSQTNETQASRKPSSSVMVNQSSAVLFVMLNLLGRLFSMMAFLNVQICLLNLKSGLGSMHGIR